MKHLHLWSKSLFAADIIVAGVISSNTLYTGMFNTACIWEVENGKRRPHGVVV
jgi:hypothetical protein